MLLSVVELLAQSSPPPLLLASCICHLIVAILYLTGGVATGKSSPAPTLETGSMAEPAVECTGEEILEGGSGNEEGELEYNDAATNADEDDELNRKAEEFIQKMNRIRKEEREKLALVNDWE